MMIRHTSSSSVANAMCNSNEYQDLIKQIPESSVLIVVGKDTMAPERATGVINLSYAYLNTSSVLLR